MYFCWWPLVPFERCAILKGRNVRDHQPCLFSDVDKISDMFGINSDTLTLNNNLIKSEDVTSLLEVTPPSSGASFAVNNQAGSNWINSSRDAVTVQEFKEEFTGLHSPATPGGTAAVAPASNVMMSAACWGSNSSTGMCHEYI